MAWTGRAVAAREAFNTHSGACLAPMCFAATIAVSDACRPAGQRCRVADLPRTVLIVDAGDARVGPRVAEVVAAVGVAQALNAGVIFWVAHRVGPGAIGVVKALNAGIGSVFAPGRGCRAVVIIDAVDASTARVVTHGC